MSDDDQTPAPTKGRKRKQTQASKNLESQRLFQERKKAQLTRLEAENNELKAIINGSNSLDSFFVQNLHNRISALEAENSFLSMNRVAIDLKSSFPVRAEGDRIECASCGVEKMKAVVAYGLVKQLEEKVAGLVLECQALRSMLAVNQFLASVEVVSLSGDTGSEGGGSNPDLSQLQPQPQLQQPPPSSAEELYGPMEFEFALIAMKSLPSLRDCVYVDKLFGTFVTQSQCKDWEEIRKLNFRTMYLRAKVLDACSVLDRHAVVESIVLFLHRNRSHIMHRDSAFLDNARNPKPVAWIPPGEVSIPKEAQKFRESLMSIKAFQDASVQPMIDEFLAVFWTPVSKRKGKDRLHRIMILGKQLEKLCDTIEDSYKVNILIEVIREGNRKQWDNLFEGMEME